MTVNINAANITSIRLAEQGTDPGTPASGFASLFVDTNGDLATVKDNTGGIKIATSPASGDWILTVDGTGTAARLNANQTFTGTNTYNQNIVLANGIGIDFSATPGTGTSGLFDDYEEGTWTPIVSGSTDAGTGTYTIQNGYYTKTGRLVTITFTVSYTNHNATGSALRVGGLPFTSANLTDNRAVGSVMTNNLNWDSGTYTAMLLNANSSLLLFYGVADNAAWDLQSPVNTATEITIYGTVSYAA